MKRHVFPYAVLIQTACSGREMDVRMPVEPPAIGVDRAKQANVHTTPLRGVQQVIGSEPAQRIEQATVMEEQGPQDIGQGEHQVVPGAVGQAVVLDGDPLIGGLFTAGGAGAAVAGVAQVFDVVTVVIGAGVMLHAQDGGAAGQHFTHRLHLNWPQIASLQQLRPAMVGREEIFKWSRFEG